MANTKPKNFRLSASALYLLDRASEAAGSTDTHIVEICLALYALQVGVEVEKARQFLLTNLMKQVELNVRHRPRTLVGR